MRRARILFVDDEPALLEGLRNLLRRDRDRWDMAFAIGGAAALEELARQPADLVVADLRMPGIDGLSLLSEVRRQWPATARMVLSGHAEEDMAWRATAVAHQFLSKPIEPDALRGVIERTLDLCRLLQSPEVLDPELYEGDRPLARQADAVVLEITERASLSEVDALDERVAALREIGFRIAVDDMGAGYAGLNTFARFVPEFVKLDRELIMALHVPATRSLVKSLSDVCRELGVSTIAEGVEQANQLECVREIGCPFVQGYLLGVPREAFSSIGPCQL